MNAPPTYEIKLAGFEFAEVTWSYGHQVTHTLESATNSLTWAKSVSNNELVVHMLEDCIKILSKAKGEAMKNQAYYAGREAQRSGIPSDNNPYDDKEKREAWRQGWSEAQSDLGGELQEEYLRLCHAAQTGVDYMIQFDKQQVTPKHLRVGINLAMVEHGALVALLMEKGIITEEEHWRALIKAMKAEVDQYQKIISRHMNDATIMLR